MPAWCAAVKYIFGIQRKMPDEGWPDNRIEMLLSELSMMDSNNFPGNGPAINT